MSLQEYFRNPESYMNIFYLSDDPVEAAQQHCDRHVVKMILETAQILSTVWSKLALNHAEEPWTKCLVTDWVPPDGNDPHGELPWLRTTLCGQRIYKATHVNHPAVLWACLYGGNYAWLYRLGMALLDEYTYRYERIHACTPVIRALELTPPPLLETVNTYCEGSIIMGSEFAKGGAVESYKNYYLTSKASILHYTRRKPPEWAANVAFFKEGA